MRYLILVSFLQILYIAQATGMTTPVLSEEEKEGLILMREEEKLAYDVYKTLYDKWDIEIFNNIAKSEKRHTQVIADLLEEYKIDDPYVAGRGEYSNKELSKLYAELTSKGKKSMNDAFQVGALIEDLDIADLDRLIIETDNEDLKIVYQNLNDASENHLNSFVFQLEQNDIEYTPVHIKAERYNDIIASSNQRGNNNRSFKKGNRNPRGKAGRASCGSKNSKKTCRPGCSGNNGSRNGRNR